MDFDEIQNFLDCERERRKTARERELERKLIEIAHRHGKAMAAEQAPLYRELTEIETNKPPMPVVIDGKIFAYVGPGFA